jgi:hypothetical protein
MPRRWRIGSDEAAFVAKIRASVANLGVATRGSAGVRRLRFRNHLGKRPKRIECSRFCRQTTGPSAKFTSSAVDYCSAPGLASACSGSSAYNVATFLNFPTFTGATAGFNPNANLDNTFVQLTGTILLNAGANSFDIMHDDGLTLSLGGGIGLVVNQPGQTGPTLTQFTVNAPAAGSYTFTLNYAECCGPPGILLWTTPSGQPIGSIPEPGALALISIGLLSVVFFVWRRRTLEA